MNKSILFTTTLCLLALFACNKEEVPESPKNQSVESNLSQGSEYQDGTMSDVLFTIGNKDNEVLENDALILTNIPEDAVSYHWDFGNGHTSTKAQPDYRYKMHGYYTISLTVTNALGEVRQASQEILVLCIFDGGKHDR